MPGACQIEEKIQNLITILSFRVTRVFPLFVYNFSEFTVRLVWLSQIFMEILLHTDSELKYARKMNFTLLLNNIRGH